MAIEIMPSEWPSGQDAYRRRAWKPVGTADPLVHTVEKFNEWLVALKGMEEVFREAVYDNADANEWDFRNHRLRLFGELLIAEGIALSFAELAAKGSAEAAEHLKEVDAKAAELFKTLLEWHMPLDFQDSVPASFKRAMADAESGDLVDLPSAR